MQETLNPIILAIGGNGQTDLSEETYTIFLANLEETIGFIKGMQDYSDIEKYKSTNEHLTEGSAHLVGAYVFFNNFHESNYSNPDLFFTGLESYNEAIEEFTNVGAMYAEE